MILDDPCSRVGSPGSPPLNYLDQFTGKAKAHTLFEAVGYGLEYSRPKVQLGGDTRRKSQQVITNWNGVYGVKDKSSIVFSNNNGSKHQGGTCSGDSGGPFFLNNTCCRSRSTPTGCRRTAPAATAPTGSTSPTTSPGWPRSSPGRTRASATEPPLDPVSCEARPRGRASGFAGAAAPRGPALARRRGRDPGPPNGRAAPPWPCAAYGRIRSTPRELTGPSSVPASVLPQIHAHGRTKKPDRPWSGRLERFRNTPSCALGRQVRDSRLARVPAPPPARAAPVVELPRRQAPVQAYDDHPSCRAVDGLDPLGRPRSTRHGVPSHAASRWTPPSRS